MFLPSAASEVEVPDYFSPSSLGSSELCGLKVLSSAQGNRERFERLPLSPSAVLGTLVHRGLELLSSRELLKPLTWLDEKLDEPSGDSAPYRCLREAVPERSIQGAREMLRGREPNPSSVHGPVMSGVAYSGSEGRVFGSEVWLESASLRLRGKADFVGRSADGTIEITDFKTGSVLGPDGDVKAEYAFQLQAYALMLQEKVEASSVRLVLDNGQRTLVPSDETSLELARERIEDITSRFAKSSTVRAEEVSNPGTECASCGIRPSCRAYLSAAPAWWVNLPGDIDFEPLDTGGTVVRVVEGDIGWTIHLEDGAGRRVKIDRLGRSHGMDASTTGEWVWLFNLCAVNRRRGFQGQRPHPRLFHELPGRDGTGQRAWDIAVFK